jgi:hypothetical protein
MNDTGNNTTGNNKKGNIMTITERRAAVTQMLIDKANIELAKLNDMEPINAYAEEVIDTRITALENYIARLSA